MTVMDMAMSALRIVTVVYLGLCAWLFLTQARYLYAPDRSVDLTPRDVGLAYDEVAIRTADGETLQAWFVPAPANAADPWTVLYCHGNAGDIGDRLDSLLTFHELGLNVLLFDYRGYGASTGKPSEQGTYADALASWRWLMDRRGIAPGRVVVLGRSLGGGVALWLALEVKPGALLMESAFTSVGDMGAAMFPYLPVRQLSRFHYDNLARIADLRVPVMIAHSPDDRTIPFTHGQRLFARAPEPKRWVEFRGDHNAGGMDIDAPYREAFRTWLKEL